jgi:hypothetical protein
MEHMADFLLSAGSITGHPCHLIGVMASNTITYQLKSEPLKGAALSSGVNIYLVDDVEG